MSKFNTNGKVTLYTEPVRAISMMIIGYFLIPYLLDAGFTQLEIGSAQSIGSIGVFIVTIFSAMLISKYGRKPIALLMNDISLILMMVVLYFTKDFLFLTVAFLLLSLNKAGWTAYMLLITEDEDESKRPFIIGFTLAIAIGGGLLYPLFGYFLQDNPIESVMKNALLIFIVILVINLLIRMKFYKETTAGIEIQAKGSSENTVKTFINYAKKIPLLFKNLQYTMLTLIYMLVAGGLMMGLVYPSYILGKGILNQAQYGNLAIGSAILTLISNFFVIPYFSKKRINEVKLFIGVTALCAVSLAGFSFVGEGMSKAMSLIYTVYMTFTFFAFTYSDTILVNNVSDEERADLHATIQILSNIAVIGYPVIFGKLLTINLEYALWFCVAIWGLIAGVAALYIFVTKKAGGIARKPASQDHR